MESLALGACGELQIHFHQTSTYFCQLGASGVQYFPVYYWISKMNMNGEMSEHDDVLWGDQGVVYKTVHLRLVDTCMLLSAVQFMWLFLGLCSHIKLLKAKALWK
mmetsp:Transcript_10783/g.22149  ORF Transcript_10783/g.22149 Transcript_10783/m.22149 type:complete len:105 (+) Transcript_10783:632-946(+)